MALDIREDTCFLQPGPSYVAPATAAPVTGPRPAPLAPSPDKENLEPPAPSPEAQAGAAPSSTPRGPAAPAHFDPDAENADPTGEGGVEAGEGRALPPRELGDEGVEACVLRPLSKERAEAMGVEVTGGEDGAAAGHGSSPGASQSPAQAMRAVPERTR